MLASRDEELVRRAAERGGEVFPWVLTFDQMLEKTSFASDMREMLQILEEAYGSPGRDGVHRSTSCATAATASTCSSAGR